MPKSCKRWICCQRGVKRIVSGGNCQVSTVVNRQRCQEFVTQRECQELSIYLLASLYPVSLVFLVILVITELSGLVPTMVGTRPEWMRYLDQVGVTCLPCFPLRGKQGIQVRGNTAKPGFPATPMWHQQSPVQPGSSGITCSK